MPRISIKLLISNFVGNDLRNNLNFRGPTFPNHHHSSLLGCDGALSAAFKCHRSKSSLAPPKQSDDRRSLT